MISIHEQMRQVIQPGIDGWIESMFANDNQPTDSISTYYPLTRDKARVYYHSSLPYAALVKEFLESMGDVNELDPTQLQAWVNYHWQYARLELAEDFSDVQFKSLSPDMERRRNELRQEMTEKGYKQS